jgi:hypothetical protein
MPLELEVLPGTKPLKASTDCLLLSYSTSSQSNFFVLSGAEMPLGIVPSPSIVEGFDVLEDRR